MPRLQNVCLPESEPPQVWGLGLPIFDRLFSANSMIVYEPVFKNHWPRWTLLCYPSGNRGDYLATQSRSQTLNTYSRNSLCLSKTDALPPLECLNWRPLLWGSWGPLVRVGERGKSSGKKQRSDPRGTVFKSSSLMRNGKLGQETESPITKKDLEILPQVWADTDQSSCWTADSQCIVLL